MNDRFEIRSVWSTRQEVAEESATSFASLRPSKYLMVSFTSALVAMVMAAATIVVATAVTVYNLSAEIQFEQFLYW